jgi:hypothetical protein
MNSYKRIIGTGIMAASLFLEGRPFSPPMGKSKEI